MSSPSTTATFMPRTPLLAMTSSTASLQASGLTPPALATTRMFLAAISGSTRAIMRTKSVA